MNRYYDQFPAPMEGYGWLHAIIGLAWMVLFVLVIYLAVRGLHHRGHYIGHGGISTTPLEIAKSRYAKGEITKAEFEQLKKDLAD